MSLDTITPEITRVELYDQFQPIIAQARELQCRRGESLCIGERPNIWLPFPLEIRPKRDENRKILERPRFMSVTAHGDQKSLFYEIQFGNTNTEDIDVISIDILEAYGDYIGNRTKRRPKISLSTKREQDVSRIEYFTEKSIIPAAKKAINFSRKLTA